jgi:hypothetical protein
MTQVGDIGAAMVHRPRVGCRTRLALALAVAMAVAGCGTPGKTAAGVVIALDATGGQVTSFTLRMTDGQVVPFAIGTLETDGAAFPASHLAVHAATLGPIAVAYREEGGRNIVYRMVDAPWARPS